MRPERHGHDFMVFTAFSLSYSEVDSPLCVDSHTEPAPNRLPRHPSVSVKTNDLKSIYIDIGYFF